MKVSQVVFGVIHQGTARPEQAATEDNHGVTDKRLFCWDERCLLCELFILSQEKWLICVSKWECRGITKTHSCESRKKLKRESTNQRSCCFYEMSMCQQMLDIKCDKFKASKVVWCAFSKFKREPQCPTLCEVKQSVWNCIT